MEHSATVDTYLWVVSTLEDYGINPSEYGINVDEENQPTMTVKFANFVSHVVLEISDHSVKVWRYDKESPHGFYVCKPFAKQIIDLVVDWLK